MVQAETMIFDGRHRGRFKKLQEPCFGDVVCCLAIAQALEKNDDSLLHQNSAGSFCAFSSSNLLPNSIDER